jgi:tRNA (cytidine/uridine-2'-O-)-methyltransferase
MFTITLLEPQIPPNTGNIARLCAATNTKLDIVGKIGFELTDRYLKRAGLDYWKYVNWEYFPSTKDYMATMTANQIHLLTTKVDTNYTESNFKDGDFIIFGSETRGIDESYLNQYHTRCFTIPMAGNGVRSLNLSSSVAVVLYEALRQTGWKTLAPNITTT